MGSCGPLKSYHRELLHSLHLCWCFVSKSLLSVDFVEEGVDLAACFVFQQPHHTVPWLALHTWQERWLTARCWPTSQHPSPVSASFLRPEGRPRGHTIISILLINEDQSTQVQRQALLLDLGTLGNMHFLLQVSMHAFYPSYVLTFKSSRWFCLHPIHATLLCIAECDTVSDVLRKYGEPLIRFHILVRIINSAFTSLSITVSTFLFIT